MTNLVVFVLVIVFIKVFIGNVESMIVVVQDPLHMYLTAQNWRMTMAKDTKEGFKNLLEVFEITHCLRKVFCFVFAPFCMHPKFYVSVIASVSFEILFFLTNIYIILNLSMLFLFNVIFNRMGKYYQSIERGKL